MFNFYLKDLPPFAKLFVGLFTALMLLVCLWSVFIFYVDKGMYDTDNPVPLYLQNNNDLGNEENPASVEEVVEDLEEISDDSLARLAPVWDSNLAGEDKAIDSIPIEEFLTRSDSIDAGLIKDDADGMDETDNSFHEQLRENVGLAHTHINGQTLLFFALGLMFLFTSVSPKIKKITLWVFGVVVLTHAIGLSGQYFHWFFDDLLAISGVTLLVVIPYICFMIFIDLGKK